MSSAAPEAQLQRLVERRRRRQRDAEQLRIRGRLPPRVDVGAGTTDAFSRRPLAATRARLTPKVRRELEHMRDELGIPDELQKAAGRAWRSVDNRFGELVYDNLFCTPR